MKAPRPNERGVAVIGGTDLVNALRLAGVEAAHVAEPGSGASVDVPRILRGWISGGKIGVILVEEGLLPLADDVVASARAGKNVLPVILEVPVHEVTADTAAAYYKALSRGFLGLDVVLEAEETPTGEDVSKPM